MSLYHSPLMAFVGPEQMPLSVVRVAAGGHPNRDFHDHDFSELAIIVAGTPLHLADSREFRLSPGDVLSLHPGAIHAYDDAEDMEIINLIYDREKLSPPMLDGWMLPAFRAIYPGEALPHSAAMLKPVVHMGKEQLQQAVMLVSELESELNNPQPGFQLGALTKFMELTLLFARSTAGNMAVHENRFNIGSALAYMNRHFAEPVTVEKLAEVSHMSLRSFFRQFRITVGCAPVEYLMQLRLRQAIRLLLQSDASISEIATECGFYDSNFFSKQFRKFYHQSPKQFRLERRIQT